MTTISTTPTHTVEVGYDEFCGALAAHDIKTLWSLQGQLLHEVPVPATQPWLWKWDTILPLAQRAGEIITMERGGDRRVLALSNPGLGGLPFTSSTLWGAIQYLGPGESAPAHRHTPSAIRFVLTGTGVYTTVEGDACQMEPGDVVVTPKWNWHDHNNRADGPMAWFDGLDLPLMVNLESVFFENHPDDVQPVVGHNISQKRFAAAGLVEAGMESPEAHSPLLRYPWGETDRALSELYDLRGGPIVALEYRNPVTGGPVVSTFGCEIHRVYPGTRTVGKRKVGSSVYVVFRGSGRSVIGGQAFDWGAGDVFVVPSWVALDHEAHESSDLFVLTDAPVLKALHQYREEVLSTQQPIERVFDPR